MSSMNLDRYFQQFTQVFNDKQQKIDTVKGFPPTILPILKKKFHKLDVILTKINTNPISYY